MDGKKTAQNLLVLHQKLLDGNTFAFEEIFEAVFPCLLGDLQRNFPWTDGHIVTDGVTDALLDYLLKPHAFDPLRGVPLDRFLFKAA
jgi:hypothetical protein